jgi:hypothetical protein
MYFFGFIKGWQSHKREVPLLIFKDQKLVFLDKLLLPYIPSGNPDDIIKVAFRIPVYQNKKVDLNDIRIFLSDEKEQFQEMGIAPKVLAYPKGRIPRHRFYGALSYCRDENPQAQNKMDSIQESANKFANECF